MDLNASNGGEQKSRLYMRNVFSNNALYLLKFEAADVRVQPLYLEPRVFEERSIDKCVQPRSKIVYHEHVDYRASRLVTLTKSYKVDRSSDRVSLMSFKKPLMKPDQREVLPPKLHAPISSRVSSLQPSVVYVNNEGVVWRLHPGVIDIKQMRRTTYEDKDQQQQFLDDLGFEFAEIVRNRAIFIVKHKKDVIKIILTITNSSFENAAEKISRGVQAVDNNAYIRGYSEITNRPIYYSLPKTTYKYTDPITKLQIKNMSLKLNRVEPHWMQEVRSKRLSEYRQQRTTNPHDQIRELEIGSSLCVEEDNCIYKARCGPIKCTVDEMEYEQWAIGYQKIDYDHLNRASV